MVDLVIQILISGIKQLSKGGICLKFKVRIALLIIASIILTNMVVIADTKANDVICVVEIRLKSGLIEIFNIYKSNDVDDEKQIEDTLSYIVQNNEIMDILKIDGKPLAETKYKDTVKDLWKKDESSKEDDYKSSDGFDLIKRDEKGEIITEQETEKQQRVNVLVDGKKFVSDVHPYIDTGRIMVPIRFMADIFGANTGYRIVNKDLKIVWIEKNQFYIYMKIGDNRAFKNDEMILMDAVPVIKDNRTFVPLSFVNKTFGYTVEYDSKINTAKICTNKGVKK